MDKKIIAILKNGNFEGIHLGKTINESLKYCGEPEKILKNEKDKNEILVYGSLQLMFNNDELIIIKLNVSQKKIKIPKSIGKTKRFNSKINIYKLIKKLEKENIDWEIEQDLSLGQQVSILTEGKARILIALDSYRIDSFELSKY